MDATYGVGTADSYGASEFTPVFSGVRVPQSLIFCVLSCWPSCFILSFFFWPLHWLTFIALNYGFWFNPFGVFKLFLKDKQNINLFLYSCGGNILINVGPSHDGVIMPIFQERLSQMGDWLRVNGEAIYSSVPWKFQNDTVTPKVW